MKKRIAAIALASMIAATGLSVLSAGASAEWVKSSSGVSYKDDNTGKKVKGWKKISGKKYYFGNDGIMRTGWVKIDGKTYYLGSDGAMRTGKVKIDGKTYTFGSDGVMKDSSKKTAKKSDKKEDKKTDKDTSKKKKKTSAQKISVSWKDSYDDIAEKLEAKDIDYVTTQNMILVRGDGEIICYVFIDKQKTIDMHCTLADGTDLNAARSALAKADYKLEYGKDLDDGGKMYIYIDASKNIAVVYKMKSGGEDYVATMFLSPEISKDIHNDENYDKFHEVMDAFGN